MTDVDTAQDALTYAADPAPELRALQPAAEALGNRSIARRRLVSHRPVSSHLYRVFPKLGISSRGELHIALGAHAVEPQAQCNPAVT